MNIKKSGFAYGALAASLAIEMAFCPVENILKARCYPREAHAATKEQLNIPEAKEEWLVKKITLPGGRYLVECFDTDGDGRIDMKQMRELVALELVPVYNYLLGKVVSYKLFPKFGPPIKLTFDRNKNRKLEPDEIYSSPGGNEDWIHGNVEAEAEI